MKKIIIISILLTSCVYAQNNNYSASDFFKQEPLYLKDRGTGLRTSIFGTYVRKGELLVYPFFEYYYDNDKEYKPSELGYNGNTDYFGKYRASEGLIFISYGFTDWLAVEFESAVISASLYKSDLDTSQMPEKFSESGFGDTQLQFDLRFLKETAKSPELNSYFEINFPFQKNRKLIGTPSWEFKAGVGVIKGFEFGTLTARFALEYIEEEKGVKAGEYAIEYLKRISKLVRIYAGVEGNEDEIELITELQLHFSKWCYLKLNNAFGLTEKATDWAPEIGIAFSFLKN